MVSILVKWLAVKIIDPSGMFSLPEILIFAFDNPEKDLRV